MEPYFEGQEGDSRMYFNRGPGRVKKGTSLESTQNVVNRSGEKNER